mgnify:CR=1 FL=1
MSDSIEFKVNVCGWHPDVGALISASEAQRVIDQMQQESNQLKNRITELEREREQRDLEQQIKGIMRVMACRELNLSEGEIDTLILMKEQLRKEREQ